MNFLTVFVTVPNLKTANKITDIVLKNKLCACVSVLKNADSYYWWKNKITRSREALLIMKTSRKNFRKLEKQIKDVHPYEVPEIVSFKIDKASKDYLNWIKKYAG
ncbi:divalent-cation tolerance protein CutA [Endomicrobium proavitum]|uniref:Periplasmic divalent cation tolerance protein n=1 Tax=Endomicrobium proavitum TaxID=1408281 RepID=A0A0G3WHV5_9BACT|nr:divalent-cation tolerance protein CutA [Endomicrobium proavitum]AKL98261.1 Periplasmic divalent cation tolerance protein [Endomicrobium proavitum]